MILYAPHMCKNPWRPEESVGSPRTRLIDGCELPNMGVGTKLRSPKSTASLILTAESSVKHLDPVFHSLVYKPIVFWNVLENMKI